MVARSSVIRRARWTGVAPLLMVVACGGGSGSTASSMMPPAAGQSPPLMATFDSIQANIFTPLCATCHSGPNPPVNLNLDATHSYNDLINVPSTEQPTIVRVKPGDPMNSFLVQHIQSDGDGASPADLSFIEQWITDGAPPGASAMAMADKFAVASAEPDTGAQLSAAPARIIVGFSQELDASRVDGTAAVLERMASDGGANAKVAARVTMPAGNPRALMVTPASALIPGSYRLVIDAPDGTAIGSIGSAGLSAPVRGESGRVVTQFTVQ
jgi:methionine-rich copper-binding protein CopC